SRDAVQAMVRQIGTALEMGVEPREVVAVSHLIQSIKSLAAESAGAGPTDATAEAGRVVPFEAGQADVCAFAAVKAPAAPAPAVTPRPESAGAHPTVRVSTEKLDAIMDVVGELMIVQSQIVESAQAL